MASNSSGTSQPTKRKSSAVDSESWMPSYEDEDEYDFGNKRREIIDNRPRKLLDDAQLDISDTDLEGMKARLRKIEQVSAQIASQQAQYEATTPPSLPHAKRTQFEASTAPLQIEPSNKTPKFQRPQHPSTKTSSLAQLQDKLTPMISSSTRLNTTALLALDIELTGLIASSSSYAGTKSRYETIASASAKHEREVADMLRYARRNGNVELVTNLEGKLVTARERHARAQETLHELEECYAVIMAVLTKIGQMDREVKCIKQKLKGLCDK